MKKLLLLAFVLMLSPLAARAQHEYSPLVEKTVNYKNWTPAKSEDRPALRFAFTRVWQEAGDDCLFRALVW